MSKTHVVALVVLLGSALSITARIGQAQDRAPAEEGAAAAALRDAGAVKNLGETRWASRIPEGASAPSFVVDASWPKPLPNDWRIGIRLARLAMQVGGIAVDSHDNIWVYHRPRSAERELGRGHAESCDERAGCPDQRCRASKAICRPEQGVLRAGAVGAQVRHGREPARRMGRAFRSGLP